MEKIRVHRDGQRDLVFQGEEIATADSKHHNDNRWTEYGLYRTAGGKWVLKRVYRTIWQGEHDGYSGEVFQTVEDLRTHFDAGITDTEYALIKEAAEAFPELESLFEDEIE